MSEIIDRERYVKHRAARMGSWSFAKARNELLLPGLVFASVGAIAWAIRGTNGWGGIDGTIVPGMLWGLLWYYLCQRKGIACYGVPLWLGLGIALGGELGYGQYVSWIRGEFRVGNEILPIAPVQGWLWFVLCGIGWGAPGGVLLGWALSARTSVRVWLGRLTIPVGVAALGWLLIQWQPALFFPHYRLGIYPGELDGHQERTVFTNTQNFLVVAWWLGALLTAALQRDKVSAVMSGIIGGGFGPGFAIAAVWCLGYVYAPSYVDWWKMWELHAGFNLGLLYVLAFYWWLRHVDQAHDREGAPLSPPAFSSTPAWRVRVGFEALGVFLVVMTIFLEEEPLTSLLMAVLYVLGIVWLLAEAGRVAPALRAELRGRLSLIYTAFLFLFVTFHGVSSTLGLILELYPADAVDQYEWPLARVLLFLPFALLIVTATCAAAARAMNPKSERVALAVLAGRMTNLMTVLAAVGAISIWPAKIGVLYALFLCLALAAFNALNRRYDHLERP